MAREMEREGFTIPLLIGGATTSKAHTAVKIAPAYRHTVVHVLDASRAVAVVGQLKSAGAASAFDAANRVEQERLREEHGEKTGGEAPALPGRGPTAQARDRLGGLRDPRARPSGHARSRGAPGRDRALHRLVARSSTPGSSRAPIRGSSRTPTGATARGSCSTTRRGARAPRGRRTLLKARGGLRLLPREQRGRRHRGLHGRRTRRACVTTFHFLRQQMDKGRASRACASPTSWPRARRAGSTGWAPSR